MATIVAARFLHEERPFTSVYTFGQPRVMTKTTAQIFNTKCQSRFFRFHNNNDIIKGLCAGFGQEKGQPESGWLFGIGGAGGI